MRFRFDCRPRFNYGRDPYELEVHPEGDVFRSPTLTLTLAALQGRGADIRRERASSATPTACPRRSRCTRATSAGSSWRRPARTRPARLSTDEACELLAETRDYWRRWVGGSRYKGRWREMVERSAMTLKLMTYAPTGALVAAPTAGLPEQIGGQRNWDYRYTWIRDASFSVHALLRPGLHRRGPDVSAAGSDARIREATGRRPAPADHVPHRRLTGPQRGGAGSPGGIPRLCSGADRQRRGRPTATRHLRRGARLVGTRGPERADPAVRGVAEDGGSGGLALRALGPARGRHLGDPVRPAGLHLRAGAVLGRARPCDPHRATAGAAQATSPGGQPNGTPSTSRS